MLMPQLPVNDLERVIEFYTHWLGFEVVQLRPLEVPSFATLVCDEVCLQFFVPNIAMGDAPARGDATLSFQVADVAALRAHIGADGGPEVYWHAEREFAIRDPSGYVLNFFEELDDHPPIDYEATDEWDEYRQDIEGECDEIPF
jgi:catechol 2,3-dioxygenase-like lactoylglutathione lyase family enzyme